MGVFIGVDVGAISLKAAVVCSGQDAQVIAGSGTDGVLRPMAVPVPGVWTDQPETVNLGGLGMPRLPRK